MVSSTKEAVSKSVYKSMLEWQYFTLLGELQQLQLHASDSSCPCWLKDIGEYCYPKHALNIYALAAETSSMDKENAELLAELAEDAKELHMKLKDHVCAKGENFDVVEWTRTWRKKLEPIYYACKVKESRAEMHAPRTACSLLDSALYEESQAGDEYISTAAKAKKEHFQKDDVERLKGIAQNERTHHLILSGVIGRNCREGTKMEKSKLPACTAARSAKLESCIQAVKDHNIKAGCCKAEGNGSKTCPNPFAVCTASVGCRS